MLTILTNLSLLQDLIFYDYLPIRKQTTRLGNSHSIWFQIIFGVPQGSISEQRLFNIFLADIYVTLKDVDIANFADANPFYSCQSTL